MNKIDKATEEYIYLICPSYVLVDVLLCNHHIYSASIASRQRVHLHSRLLFNYLTLSHSCPLTLNTVAYTLLRFCVHKIIFSTIFDISKTTRLKKLVVSACKKTPFSRK